MDIRRSVMIAVMSTRIGMNTERGVLLQYICRAQTATPQAVMRVLMSAIIV